MALGVKNSTFVERCIAALVLVILGFLLVSAAFISWMEGSTSHPEKEWSDFAKANGCKSIDMSGHFFCEGTGEFYKHIVGKPAQKVSY